MAIYAIPMSTISPTAQADIEMIVVAVSRRKLALMVLLLLEMYRPLSGIAQALWIGGSPVLVPLLGKELADRIQAIIEHPEALHLLVERLESASREESR